MNKGRKGRKGRKSRYLSIYIYMRKIYICVCININTLIHKITYILKHCALFIVIVNDTNGLSMGRNVFIAPFIAPFLLTLRPFLKKSRFLL